MLGDDNPDGGTETSAIFAGTNSDIKVVKPRKSKHKKKNLFDALKEKEQELGLNVQEQESELDVEDDRRVTLIRELAKRISQKISQTKQDTGEGFSDGQTELKTGAAGTQSDQSLLSTKATTSVVEDSGVVKGSEDSMRKDGPSSSREKADHRKSRKSKRGKRKRSASRKQFFYHLYLMDEILCEIYESILCEV